MKKVVLTVFALFVIREGGAQVINVEGKRFIKDTNGFVGRLDLLYNVTQNVQRVTVISSNIHAQYKKNAHRLLAISDFAFIKAGSNDFVNSGYGHLRYNGRLNKWLTIESFVQAQYNRALLLDRRFLAGAGPRLKLLKKTHIKLYAASLYMYEFQSQNNDSLYAFNNRVSSYLSITLDFSKIDFSGTVYYQPNVVNINDYRLAGDLSFELEITRRLNYRTSFNFLFDTRQPIRIPAFTYILRNGLSFKF